MAGYARGRPAHIARFAHTGSKRSKSEHLQASESLQSYVHESAYSVSETGAKLIAQGYEGYAPRTIRWPAVYVTRHGRAVIRPGSIGLFEKKRPAQAGNR